MRTIRYCGFCVCVWGGMVCPQIPYTPDILPPDTYPPSPTGHWIRDTIPLSEEYGTRDTLPPL